MTSRLKRNLRRIFITLAVIYMAGGILLYFSQDLLLFHPTPLPASHRFSFDQEFSELNIPSGKNNISIIRFSPEKKTKGIVLFFHGNMHNVEHYKKYPAFFLRNGYALWMIDYPGFGKTTGERTEKNMYQQALIMYDSAARYVGGDSIVIYGKSIGTGIASYLASQRLCRQLILETPYYSIDALAKHYFPFYPVVPMTKFSFPVYSYLSGLKIPVTIFHGTKDEVVPFAQGARLAKENPGIEFITIENGKHNNLSGFTLYQTRMDALLQQ